MTDPQTIAIVGTGLVGGSIGLGLRAAGYGGGITGVGRRQATLDKAKALGCIDGGTLDIGEAAGAADLVVLATPLGYLDEALRQLAGRQRPGATITDVGSVKSGVCRAAAAILPRPGRFVGSHPMAGSERQGAEHARADLFRGRPCVIVTGEAEVSAIAAVEWLWRMLGMRVLPMGAREHDEQVAAISHLPHAAAAMLMQVAAGSGGLGVASSGLADTTRVASGDPELWADILLANGAAVLGNLHEYARWLEKLGELIASQDRGGLLAVLRASKRGRDEWMASQPTLGAEST